MHGRRQLRRWLHRLRARLPDNHEVTVVAADDRFYAGFAKLWDLVGVATPLAIMVIVQVIVIMIVAGTVVFRLMGRDYEAAVMAGGFCGFMLGTTANAMANMEALVRRYGPAPKAFLVVPMVGAFFVDFTNAIIITFCLNIFR